VLDTVAEIVVGLVGEFAAEGGGEIISGIIQELADGGRRGSPGASSSLSDRRPRSDQPRNVTRQIESLPDNKVWRNGEPLPPNPQ